MPSQFLTVNIEDVSFQFHFLIFLQNFLAANSQCWWNTPLTAATRSLKYAGHVAPGMLLVTAEPCALEILRGAYARSVLKPPATYTISSVGESRRAFSSVSKLHVHIAQCRKDLKSLLLHEEIMHNVQA